MSRTIALTHAPIGSRSGTALSFRSVLGVLEILTAAARAASAVEARRHPDPDDLRTLGVDPAQVRLPR